MSTSLIETIAGLSNDHRPITRSFETCTATAWHEKAPEHAGRAARISVVITARNTGYCVRTVLDALATQRTSAAVQVIVVDDASGDDTARIIAAHPRPDLAVHLSERAGIAAARNVGICLAEADTLVFLDADMVLAEHVLNDIAARSRDDVALIGFRQNVPFPHSQDEPGRQLFGPEREPDLDADHRVRWSPPAGVPMFYSGQIYEKPFTASPLNDTNDFIELGHGCTYFDWDLPRMFGTALAAAPRQAVLDVGGMHAGFTASGWGFEDTHLGAALIAHGCKIIPLRQARGWHLDTPDAPSAWNDKLASVPDRLALLRHLLRQPPPTGRESDLRRRTAPLLRKAKALK